MLLRWLLSTPRALRRPTGGGLEAAAAVAPRVRSRVVLVSSSNHVELDDGWLLWLHPALAAPGQSVTVLAYGSEVAVWTAQEEPRLLGVHRFGEATYAVTHASMAPRAEAWAADDVAAGWALRRSA